MEQIAEELNIREHKAGNHVRNIYHELHVRSRSGTVARALQEDLL